MAVHEGCDFQWNDVIFKEVWGDFKLLLKGVTQWKGVVANGNMGLSVQTCDCQQQKIAQTNGMIFIEKCAFSGMV